MRRIWKKHNDKLIIARILLVIMINILFTQVAWADDPTISGVTANKNVISITEVEEGFILEGQTQDADKGDVVTIKYWFSSILDDLKATTKIFTKSYVSDDISDYFGISIVPDHNLQSELESIKDELGVRNPDKTYDIRLNVEVVDVSGGRAEDYLDIKIDYNRMPSINLTSPTDNAIFSEVAGYKTITISGTSKDDNIGDELTIKYTIEDSANAPLSGYDSKIIDNIISDGTKQKFSDLDINIDGSIPEDNYTLKIWVEDDQGATSSISTITLIVDKTLPSDAVINISETDWTSNDVTFTLDPPVDNESGVEKQEYQIDDGVWTEYIGEVTITDEGQHTVKARTIDRAGNIGNEVSESCKIDKTNPTITAIYTYKGTIYVLGEDNNLLHTKPYGFQFMEDGTIMEELIVEDDSGFDITISTNSTIPAGSKAWKETNSLTTKIPIDLNFILRDIAENEDKVAIIIDNANRVFYGTVPQNIQDMIDAEIRRLSPPKSKSSDIPEEIIIVDSTINDAMKQAIGETLNASEVIENEAPLNSEYAQITVNISDYLDNKYDGLINYRLDVIQKNSMQLVYTMMVDSAENVEVPKLSDSTTYIIRISVVTDGSELAFKEIEKITKDRTAPIIENISVDENGYLAIEATDNTGLHEKSYKYELKDGQIMNEKGEVAIEVIGGFEMVNLGYVACLDMVAYDDSSWKFKDWVSDSRIQLSPGAKLKIKVRDTEGNYTETEEIIADEGNLQRLVNEDNPMEIDVNGEIDFNDLINNIIDSNLVDGQKINLEDYKIQIPSDSAQVVNGKLIIKDLGTIIINFVNKETGEIIQYMLEAVGNLQFHRRIIVRTDSQTELTRAFEKILYETFSTNKDIVFESDSDLIEIEKSILTANQEGIAKISAKRLGRSVTLYVVISDTISGVLSNIDVIKDNIGYTILIDKEIDVVKYLELYPDKDTNINSSYVVVESFNSKVLEANGRIIKGINDGITTIRVIDLVKGVIKITDLKVVSLKNELDGFKDINNHWAKGNIENLMKNGIVEGYIDKGYKPDEYISTKEFLVLLNRYKLFTDIKSEKILKTIRLSKSDWAYYDIANVLSGMTEQEAEFIETFNDFNKKLSREEAFYIISRVVNLSSFAENDEKLINDSKYNIEIEKLIAIGLLEGYEDGTYKIKDRLTRAEAAALVERLIELYSTIFSVEQ